MWKVVLILFSLTVGVYSCIPQCGRCSCVVCPECRPNCLTGLKTHGNKGEVIIIFNKKFKLNSGFTEFEFNLIVCNVNFQETGMVQEKILAISTKDSGTQ